MTDDARDAIEARLDVLATVVPESPRVAFYVSTPITTGACFVSWRRGAGRTMSRDDPGWDAALRSQVIEPNAASARPVVDRLRDGGRVVIDPTALPDVPGWTQPDYHTFWTAVIERFVDSVVFVDGWEYSVGATLELIQAMTSERTILGENLAPLSAAEIHDRIAAAIDDVETDGVLPSGPLRNALDRITALDPSVVAGR